MSNKYLGSCLCGSVKYEVSGEFKSFFLCHCVYCQKDSGAAFAANLFANTSTLTWLQGDAFVKIYRHTNTSHVKSFCQNCGSALPTMTEDTGCVMVPAGSLDSPVPMLPTAKIFVASRARWSDHLDHLPGCEALPERAAGGATPSDPASDSSGPSKLL